MIIEKKKLDAQKKKEYADKNWLCNMQKYNVYLFLHWIEQDELFVIA